MAVCSDGTAKVGDVGMAKIMAEDYVSGGQGAFGTLAWCAGRLPTCGRWLPSGGMDRFEALVLLAVEAWQRVLWPWSARSRLRVEGA